MPVNLSYHPTWLLFCCSRWRREETNYQFLLWPFYEIMHRFVRSKKRSHVVFFLFLLHFWCVLNVTPSRNQHTRRRLCRHQEEGSNYFIWEKTSAATVLHWITWPSHACFAAFSDRPTAEQRKKKREIEYHPCKRKEDSISFKEREKRSVHTQLKKATLEKSLEGKKVITHFFLLSLFWPPEALVLLFLPAICNCFVIVWNKKKKKLLLLLHLLLVVCWLWNDAAKKFTRQSFDLFFLFFFVFEFKQLKIMRWERERRKWSLVFHLFMR